MGPTQRFDLAHSYHLRPRSRSFLRQGSEQWRALHAGVLTTGNLKEALGLREAAAARIVGGKAEVGTSAEREAAFHYCKLLCLPPLALGAHRTPFPGLRTHSPVLPTADLQLHHATLHTHLPGPRAIYKAQAPTFRWHVDGVQG